MKKTLSIILSLILVICASVTTAFAALPSNIAIKLTFKGLTDMETHTTSGTLSITYPKSLPGTLHVGSTTYKTGQTYTTDGFPDIPDYDEKNFNPSVYYESSSDIFALNLKSGVAAKGVAIHADRACTYALVPIISSKNYRIDVSESEVKYTGKAVRPSKISVVNTKTNTPLIENTDYTVKVSNNTNAGNATITINGAGQYIGTLSKTFKITPKDINDTNMEWYQAGVVYMYDGKPHSLPCGVKNTVTGQTLKSGVDVKYTSTNNVNAGTDTTTVTGMGNYKGTKTFNFKISKAGNQITGGNATATYHKKLKSNKTFTLKGKAKFGKITYKKVSGNKNITVSSAGKVTAKKGLKPGTYNVKVKMTVAGTSNYNGANANSTVKIVVKKK